MLGRRTDGWADGRSMRRRVLSGIRRIAGMPDYAAHVEHLRRCHPEAPIPSEREYYDDFVRARYGDGPTRCC
jgi:uncharacterized short protein YbdD (DUF466 family)